MSSAVTCPKCRKPVSLPVGIDPNAWVRCPLCLAKYQFQMVLNAMPPMLEVIPAPFGAGIVDVMDDTDEVETSFEPAAEAAIGEEPSFQESFAASSFEETSSSDASEDELPFESTPSEAPAFGAMHSQPVGAKSMAAASGLIELGEDEDTLPAMEAGSLAAPGAMPNYHDTHGFRQSPAEDDEDSGVLELQPDEGEWQSQPPVVAPDAAAGGLKVRVSNRKKRQKNPVLEILKIAAAGILGLVIGYFVLLWVAKTDILNLAEVLPPFLVPESLRPAYQQMAQRPAVAPQPAQNGSDPWGGAATSDDASPAGADQTAPPMGDGTTPDQPPTLDGNEAALPGVAPATPPMGETNPPPMPPTANPFDAADPLIPPQGEPMPPPAGELPANTPPANPPPSETQPATPPANSPMANVPPMTPDSLPSPFDEPQPKAPAGDAATPMPPAVPETSPTPPAPMDQSAPATPQEDAKASEPAMSVPTATAPPAEPSPMADPGFPPVPEPMPPQAPPAVGPKSDTKYTLDQVNQAITAASDNAKALNSAGPDVADATLRQLKAKSYRSYAELAEAVTLMNENSDSAKAARAAALTMLQSNTAGMPKLNQLGKLAASWMTSPYRKGTGIALAARVEETAPEGKLFRTRMKLLGQDQPESISVLSAADPQIKPMETIVLLGTVVAAPAINLHDYSGTEETVIWASAMGPAQLE